MREALIHLLEPVVEKMGYELVELEFAQSKGGGSLRIYIDKPAGITVDDCAAVSHSVSQELEQKSPIKNRYTLEVSSPGFDRVLRKRAHFERFLGRAVQVELKLPQDGRRRFGGQLKALADEAVVVEVDKRDFVLPIDRIHKARLKHE
jgi:ribosome maturation factor RimP